MAKRKKTPPPSTALVKYEPRLTPRQAYKNAEAARQREIAKACYVLNLRVRRGVVVVDVELMRRAGIEARKKRNRAEAEGALGVLKRYAKPGAAEAAAPRTTKKIVRAPAADALPGHDVPEVLDGQLVQADGADPFKVFVQSCDERSRSTMRARLNAAAGILIPGTTAEAYPWATLDHVAVVHVLDKLKDQSPSTRNLTRAALRKMAKVLFGLRLMSIDVRQRIDDVPPARGKRLPRGRALDSRQLRKLFAACRRDATVTGTRDAALLAVLFGGGLRRDEASRLDVADVRDGALRVVGKGNKEALQPIVAEVAQAIAAWIEVRGDHAGALFTTINKHGRVSDRRLDGKAIAWTVDKRATEAAIEPLPDGHVLSPHDLRRSYGTALLEAGEDIATVAKAMRHSSISTTSIYDRRDERKVAEAVGKLHVPVGR